MFSMSDLSIELQLTEKSFSRLSSTKSIRYTSETKFSCHLLLALILNISFPLKTNNYYQLYNVNSKKILCLFN